MVETKETDTAKQTDQLLREYLRKYHQTTYSPENEDIKIGKLKATKNNQALQSLFTELLGYEPENILDVGCGTCNFLRGLPPTWNKVGLEYRPEAVEIARLLVDEKTQIHQGSAEDMLFHSNQFDVVTSFQVLEHVKNPEVAIREMFRVVKAGGLVYGEVPNKLYPKEGHIGLIYPQLLPMWLRKPYIDFFGIINQNSVEFEYLQNIHYFTPRQILGIHKKYASRVLHLTPMRLQQRFKKYFNPTLAKILGSLGAHFAGIRFVAVK
jgi:ubiquinone/menaquinone biosynthesis C-methylase UbiE